MSVFLDVKSSDHHLLTEGEGLYSNEMKSSIQMNSCINIGLVNNMPDSALVSTERQLFELLNAAAEKIPVRLRLYALPTVLRTDWGKQYVSRFYSNISSMWDEALDGIIVTGAEPRAPELVDEPYWSSLGQVIDWAKENTISSIWSCLAVHGAVLYLDGIDRHVLGEKCIGVFDQVRAIDHPLTRGIPLQLRIPHSRWNEVREQSLISKGYSILTKSAEAGVDLFVKQQEKSLFVYFQGHPEYEAQSLLGEYRRDAGRFLRGEIESYPTMPKGYFAHKDKRLLAAFQKRALSDRRDELLALFPVDRVALNLRNTWHSAATRIYRNWISMLARGAGGSMLPPADVREGEATSHSPKD